MSNCCDCTLFGGCCRYTPFARGCTTPWCGAARDSVLDGKQLPPRTLHVTCRPGGSTMLSPSFMYAALRHKMSAGLTRVGAGKTGNVTLSECEALGGRQRT